MKDRFAKDVRQGFSCRSKSIHSKYLYDKKGSDFFSKIMKLPEYYLTKAEKEIFQQQSFELINCFQIKNNTPFKLIELGAGDGSKTVELIKELKKEKYLFEYIPIDISQEALNQLEKNMHLYLPDLSIEKKCGDYLKILNFFINNNSFKVILFLGSNMGNMADDVAKSFLRDISKNLNHKDKIILGLDLIKPKEIVLPAYNDSKKVTRDFNLNLLVRINNELGGNFDVDNFYHKPHYDELKGVASSYLVSKKAQKIYISYINMEVFFNKEEQILIEISRKYDDKILTDICKHTGLNMVGKFLDSKHYFADYVLEKSSKSIY